MKIRLHISPVPLRDFRALSVYADSISLFFALLTSQVFAHLRVAENANEAQREPKETDLSDNFS